jgi:hypothetical protein
MRQVEVHALETGPPRSRRHKIRPLLGPHLVDTALRSLTPRSPPPLLWPGGAGRELRVERQRPTSPPSTERSG